MTKKIAILNKKFIEVLTFIVYILAMIVFEIGYCNSTNVINVINGDFSALNYNFSLCRIIIYIIFIITLIFVKNKFINESIDSLENKYKRVFVYLYLMASIVVISAAVTIIIKNPILVRGMSIGILTILMGMIFLLYISNNAFKNIIITTFSVGLIFTIATEFNHAIDEKKHFMSAFNVAFGNFDYNNNPITDTEVEKLPHCTKFTRIDEFLSTKYEPNITTDVNKEDVPSTPASYNPITYLFPALGIFIARIFGGSIIDLYILGRVFNLILYCILACITIKLIPYKKNILMTLFLMPISLLIAASYSVDGFCIGMVAVLIAYCLKLKKEKETISLKDFAILVGLFLLTLLAKSMAYVLVAAIFLMLPVKETLKKNKKYIPIMIGVALISIIILAFLAIQIKNTKITSDTRGTGEISVSAQLSNLIHNPIFDVKLILSHIRNTLLSFDWLSMLHDQVFFTKDAKCVFLPLLIFILYVALTEDDFNFKLKDKFIMIISFFLVYLMTSMVLYLSFTQVGAMYIAGYQARYILPILPLLLFCISNNKVLSQNKQNRNLNITIISGIFIAIGIMQNIIV